LLELNGIFSGIDQKDYRNSHGISQSTLQTLRFKTPAHVKYLLENKSAPTPAMILGSIIHGFALEPEQAEKDFVVRPEISKVSKEGKAIHAEFEKLNSHRTIVTSSQYDEGRKIAEAVRNHKVAGHLIRSGERELSMWWDDDDTGIKCKARPDIILDDGIIIDLKTTENASLEEFQKSIYNYGYFIQAYFYLWGLSKYKQNVKNFIFICVEKSPPHAVAVYYLNEAAIDKGREMVRKLLDIYAAAVKTNEWPGYSEEIQPISLPHWGFN